MFAPISSDLPAWCTALLSSHIFWQFRLPEKEVRMLSPGQNNGYVKLLPALLTDLNFASTLIYEGDFPRFKFFIQHLRQGKPDRLSFRIINQLGQWRSAQMAFVSHPGEPGHMQGYFLDISDQIETPAAFSPEKPPMSSSRTPDMIQHHPVAEGEETDLPGLLTDLCDQQKKSPAPLFDALAVLIFQAEKSSERWIAHGFDHEAPGLTEINRLSSRFRQVFEGQSPAPFIVNDTHNSQEPLDWAVFVRSSLQSYRAEPLVHRRSLKGTLIFASRKPWRFHTDRVEMLDQMVEMIRPLLLQKW